MEGSQKRSSRKRENERRDKMLAESKHTEKNIKIRRKTKLREREGKWVLCV